MRFAQVNAVARARSGTLVILTHHDLPTAETDLHKRGWVHYVDRLAGVAEGKDIGLDPGLQG